MARYMDVSSTLSASSAVCAMASAAVVRRRCHFVILLLGASPSAPQTHVHCRIAACRYNKHSAPLRILCSALCEQCSCMRHSAAMHLSCSPAMPSMVGAMHKMMIRLA